MVQIKRSTPSKNCSTSRKQNKSNYINSVLRATEWQGSLTSLRALISPWTKPESLCSAQMVNPSQWYLMSAESFTDERGLTWEHGCLLSDSQTLSFYHSLSCLPLECYLHQEFTEISCIFFFPFQILFVILPLSLFFWHRQFLSLLLFVPRSRVWRSSSSIWLFPTFKIQLAWEKRILVTSNFTH